MDYEAYLKQVLETHSLADDSSEIKDLRAEKENVETLIRSAFDGSPIIRYAGSYKKGTMIKDSYDLDIICYFKSEDDSAGENLEEIYNNIKLKLEDKYTVIPKKSALRLHTGDDKDFHIDVVPGRFVDDTLTDAFIHQHNAEKQYTKTNLQKHIEHIKNSGLTNTIKLVKIWRELNSVPLKTFVLELLVIRLLKDKKDSDGLANCLKCFFEETNEHIENIVLEDPANSGNDLSELFDDNTRALMKALAGQASGLISNDQWKNIFGELQEDKNLFYRTQKGIVVTNTPIPNSTPITANSPWRQ